jgi:hypothetical protein
MKQDTLALTPEATIVWPDLFEPISFNGGDEQYRATLLIEKDADLTLLVQAINAAARKKFPGQPEQFYKQLRKPIRKGAEKAVDDNGNPAPESFYHNRYFINVKSKYQPHIVNLHNEPITDPNDIYGGCVVRAYLSFFGYDHAGNTGVSCSLRALVKISDGDPIGGGKVNTGAVFASVIQKRATVFENGAFETGMADDDIRF